MIEIAHTPLARILAHESAYWTSIAEVEQRDGWKLFHNRTLIPRVDPNHAGEFRSTASAETIVEHIVAFYRELGATPVAYVDCLSTPADLPERLIEAGFQEWIGATNDLMLYVGPDQAAPTTVQVDVVRSEADRLAWAAIVEEEANEEERRLMGQLYLTEISDPRITAYLVRIEGEAVGRAELFSADGLGRVEAVRTLARFRRRGLAAALVRRAILDSLAYGNGLTYIYSEPGSDAQRLYTRLGFRTVTNHVTRGFSM